MAIVGQQSGHYCWRWSTPRAQHCCETRAKTVSGLGGGWSAWYTAVRSIQPLGLWWACPPNGWVAFPSVDNDFFGFADNA